MPTEKELKYLAKIQGKSAPAVAIEHIIESAPPLTDNRLQLLVEAVSALQIGVAASIDEDGSVFLGKGTDDNTNHYIIIESPEVGGGIAYAFANQDKNAGEVFSCNTIEEVVSMFRNKTN